MKVQSQRAWVTLYGDPPTTITELAHRDRTSSMMGYYWGCGPEATGNPHVGASPSQVNLDEPSFYIIACDVPSNISFL
jgi:hypothetical protein